MYRYISAYGNVWIIAMPISSVGMTVYVLTMLTRKPFGLFIYIIVVIYIVSSSKRKKIHVAKNSQRVPKTKESELFRKRTPMGVLHTSIGVRT